ncbi:DUF4129 domain-containing protein [Timonella sp. A28]|uniref:DUF4129 domain-containing protein n=1 Tax=Timonella sp. A28 TaxID=3442640 RepID=UPI003EBC4A2F
MNVPVVPDDETARNWLETELRNPIYNQSESWFSRILRKIGEWFDSLSGASFPPLSIFIFVALFIVLVVVAVIISGPIRRTRKARASVEVFTETVASSSVYLDNAARYYDEKDLSQAVAELFRAVIRHAEELALINEQAGRTAREAAYAIGHARPPIKGDVEWLASLFDAVAYGDEDASEEEYGRARRVFDLLDWSEARA